MKKSISRSSSIRTISKFTFVTYLDTLERAHIFYSISKRTYYLSYSFLNSRYLHMPLGGLDDFRDDFEVITVAANYIYNNFQNPSLCLNS